MSNKPSYILFHLRNYKTPDGEEKAMKTRLGSLWPNKDGQGHSIRPDMPIVLVPGETYLIREPEGTEEQEATSIGT